MDVVQIEVNCVVICPMPDDFLVGYTEEQAKDSKKMERAKGSK